jgi:hypothetical protein
MRIILVYNEIIFINSLHQKISALKRTEFVNNRMSYIVLRSCRCDIIGLNSHSPTYIILLYIYIYIYIYSLNPSLCTGTLDVENVKIVNTI